MLITRLRIENFRSIKRVDLDLTDTTVLIGPNNSGKTAILDALRIALTRRWGQRGTGFTEYDVHLSSDADDPRTSPAVSIEIEVAERTPGEWGEEVLQALDDISQTNPQTGASAITLRAGCEWSEADKCFQPSWTFLNVAREPLTGASAKRINLDRFWQYLPVFYLGALRNADDEFSSRSQFWGRLLKTMVIPQEIEGKIQKSLDELNQELLTADPRLKKIAESIAGATKVAARDRDGKVDLRVLPLKGWDLLSKTEIILRNEPDWPWLPLSKHGQGLQSLSVIYLFQAFVEHVLGELYAPESTPVLALEEPETHLHPQAARALWSHVSGLPGQKLVTTHSPYFVQHVPFRDLRIVRLTKDGTQVYWLPARFSTPLPHCDALDTIASSSKGLLAYSRSEGVLTVNGKLPRDVFRSLLTCYGSHADKDSVHRALREFSDRSANYMSDEDLNDLETFARRIRGEIFFANRWLIVEGQAEYLLIHAIAKSLDYDLDEHGVSVIDAQNNGSPPVFAALARALGIPWLAVFDGDEAGRGFRQGLLSRGFVEAEVNRRCSLLPAGNLEEQLLADGLEAEVREALRGLGHADAKEIDALTLKKRLDGGKPAYAAELAKLVLADRALASRMPANIRTAITALRGLN